MCLSEMGTLVPEVDSVLIAFLGIEILVMPSQQLARTFEPSVPIGRRKERENYMKRHTE